MNARYSTGPLLLVWALCIAHLGGPNLYAQNAQLPDTVRRALERYPAVDPLAVTWSQKTEAAEMGKQKLDANLLARIVSYNTNALQIAFRDGRIYVRSEGYGNSRFPLDNTEFAFDGKVFYMGTPTQTRRKNASLQKLLPQHGRRQARYFEPSYFRAAGIRVASRIQELATTWHPQSELLALLTEGGQVEKTGDATVEGRHLVRIQVAAKDLSLLPPDLSDESKAFKIPPKGKITEKDKQRNLEVRQKLQNRRPPPRHHDFYLDPECGYAVRRYEIRDEVGHFVMRTECSEYEQLAGRGIWLPRRCRLEEYTFEGVQDEETLIPIVFESPLYVSQFLVQDFELQPWPQERFELKYTEPGTRINDGTFPGVNSRHGVAYTIPADVHQLDAVIDAAKATYSEKHQGSGKQYTAIKMLLLVINGVALSLLVFYLMVRRRKKASKA